MPDKGSQIVEGKTKVIWAVDGDPTTVIVEHKDTITAHDDPSLTKEFATKAIHSTTTTCRVFELLRDAGIPVAFREQLSPTEFLADNCLMIPLEVIARRLAVGSYLKRFPHLTPDEGCPPQRFHSLEVEFFLKTTRGELISSKGETLVSGLDWSPEGGQEDPFIPNPEDETWKLFHSKKPGRDPEADLQKSIEADKVLGDESTELIHQMNSIMRRVFLVLEGAWNTLGLRLIDMKIEFGINQDDQLVVSDVIDNDSWRLRTKLWEELSKQSFRDGEDLSEVEHKYGIVARLVENFRIPQQAIIIWKGSESDGMDIGDCPIPQGVDIEDVVLSGHKCPQGVVTRLEEIIADYPDGGVIIAKVGRSNGLGPLLAARTSWPVIAVPANFKSFPDDIWSSLRMPSKVPMLTAWPDSNAMLAALNILAASNPSAFMLRQASIEKFD